MLSPNSFISEMRLITGYKRNHHHKCGFADVFLCDGVGNSAILELKLFNILGLYNGLINRKWESNPDFKQLENLDKKLKNESDECLMNRNYKYWCKDENQYKLVRVQEYMDEGFKHYLNTLQSGKANLERNKVGILEDRIIVDYGFSHLKGFLVSSFGSQRLLVKETYVKLLKINEINDN